MGMGEGEGCVCKYCMRREGTKLWRFDFDASHYLTLRFEFSACII